MLGKILEKFTYDIGIDLGTSNTLVYVKGKGILIHEPSVVTLYKKTKEILAVGTEAKKMLGKTPASMIAIRPLRDGVISDFHVAEKMIAYFINSVHAVPSKFPKIPRPRVVLGVPSGITPVERKAVVDAAKSAGAREAFLLEEPMAAAIGAGLPVEDPCGSLIVDMGGGTTEVAVISLGGVVVGKSLRIAGDRLDAELVNYAREKYDLLLGEKTAEDIKCRFGSAADFKGEDKLKAVLRGRDLKTGLPRSVEVSSMEIREAIKTPVRLIVNGIKDVIEDTPAELMPDILGEGIVLAGGTSLLREFPKFISHEIRVPVRLADDPIACVVRGCAKVLNDAKLLAKVAII